MDLIKIIPQAKKLAGEIRRLFGKLDVKVEMNYRTFMTAISAAPMKVAITLKEYLVDSPYSKEITNMNEQYFKDNIKSIIKTNEDTNLILTMIKYIDTCSSTDKEKLWDAVIELQRLLN